MALQTMEHNITQADSNITSANGTVAIMSDIFTYKVPRHTAIRFRPEDIISAYCKDAGSEALGTDTWELVVSDPNQLTTQFMASGIYTVIKEFQDRNKTKKLGLSKLVKSDFYVKFRFKATTVLVYTSCYFQLTCQRIAETL